MNGCGRPRGFLSWGMALAIFLAAPLPAYARNLKFTSLGMNEGLSQSLIYWIIKDHKGFMWFATKDGLNRYDGIQFTTFNHEMDDPESLSSNFVKVIHEDRQGILWIGTENGGLNRMESGSRSFRHFRHDPKNPRSLINDSVTAVCQDRRGNLWVGTEQGLDCMLAGSENFIHFRPDARDAGSISGRSVMFIVPGNDDCIWIGLQGQGLDCYDRRSGRFSHFRSDRQDPQTLEGDNVASACLAPDNSLWVGTASGLNRLDTASGQVTRYYEPELEDVRSLAIDSQGNLWAATNENGIFFLLAGGRQFTRYRHDRNDPEGLNSDSILFLYADDTGILWVGTDGMGINKANPQSHRFTNFVHEAGNADSLGFASIRAIYEDRSRTLYIGGYGGLDLFDRRSGQWKHFAFAPQSAGGLKSRDVYALCPDSEDERDPVWVGTEGRGLSLFDPVKNRFTIDPIPSLRGQYIFALYKDRQGSLWIGSDEGLSQYDRKTKQVRFIDLRQAITAESTAAPDARNILEDSGGTLWVGSGRYGLFALDRKSGQWRRFFFDPQNPHSLSNNWITSIYESRAGEMWLGTNGGGLNRMDRATGTFSHFTAKMGLPNDVVYGILEDGTGCLWLSTNLGLSRFNPRDRTFRNYDKKDGLFGNEFNSSAFHMSRWSGEFFFGGVNGLAAFFPSEIKDDAHVPAVVITDFKIFNRSLQPGPRSPLKQPISETREIVLSFRDSMLTFEFIGLHYSAPSKNLYAYRMEGFDREWNTTDAGRRFATYTNLDPGRYTFRVKAANSDGVWNETGTSLAIVITPPFWNTWWFFLICTLVVGITIYSIHEYRVSQLKKREKMLSRQVEERTHELNDALKQVENANRELAEANTQLERLSLTDPLTQLPNRRNFELIFAQEWKRCTRESQPLSLLMIDIDFFKLYNDTYGHPEGDECLKRVAAAIFRSVSRAGDFVARLGGEEFAVILPNTSKSGAHAMAERIRENTERLNIPHRSSDVKSSVTISIGASTLVPDRDQESETLIALSDQALYQAKSRGRNRVCSTGSAGDP